MPLFIKGVPSSIITNQFTNNNILDNVDLKTFNSQLYFDLQNTNSLVLDSGVRQIADLSGNNNHPTQNTAANRPEYTHILGLPCVRFNIGMSNRWLNFNDQFFVQSQYQIFSVLGRGSSRAWIQGNLSSSSNKCLHFGLDDTTFHLGHYNNDYAVTIGTSPLNTPIVVNIGLNSTGKFIKINGYPINQSTQTTLLSAGSTGMFGRAVNATYQCFIHEYVAFNRNLDVDTSNLIEAYLARKWKTTNRFNPNHIHYNLAIAA